MSELELLTQGQVERLLSVRQASAEPRAVMFCRRPWPIAAALTLALSACVNEAQISSASSAKASSVTAVSPPKPMSRTDVPGCDDRLNALIDGSVARMANDELGARAARGDALAQDEMGRRTGLGLRMPVDSDASFDWYLKAAKQGLCTAEANLAYMYLHGEGVERDLSQAVHWYRLAADDGETRAMCALGWMAAHGIGLPKDGDLVIAWWRAGADRGDYQCQRTLGHELSYGSLVPHSPAEGAFWAGLAHGWESHGAAGRYLSTNPAPLPDRPSPAPR